MLSCLQVWCTFSEEQIDIDAFGDKGEEFIYCELKELAERCAVLAAWLHCHAHSI